MYGKILVGYDRSDQADDALVLGKQLADATGAKLVVAGVFPFDPVWTSRVDSAFRKAEEQYATQVEQAARAVEAEAEAIPSSSAARGLHELAEEIEADLVVVGSSHRSPLGRALAGSVGTALLHGSPCAVAVAPRGYQDRSAVGITAIVVGFDGSAESGLAVMTGWELARRTGARLKLVSVAVPPIGAAMRAELDPRRLPEAIGAQLRTSLAEARRTVPEDIEVEATLITGDAAAALKDMAGRPGTILVVGSRGYGPLRRVLLGSVSTRLVQSAPCPVLVVPRGTTARHANRRQAEVAEAS